METNSKNQNFSILIAGIVAVVIVVIDIIFASEASIALTKSLVIMLVFVLLTLFRYKDKAKLKELLTITGIFLVVGVIAYIFPYLNNLSAQSSADKIIKAVENYKARTGSYPQNLEDLKPDFLTEIPKAKYTFLWNNFYLIDGNLVYVNAFPYNIMKYDFIDGKWIWCKPEICVKMFFSES
ncbi:MAG: hypothetical protein K6357_08270 [Elusimicrobiota bacterium]